MVSDNWVLGVSEWNCGSMELGSERKAMVRSRACAMPAAPRKQAAMADKRMVLRMSFIVCCPLYDVINGVSQTLRKAANTTAKKEKRSVSGRHGASVATQAVLHDRYFPHER